MFFDFLIYILLFLLFDLLFLEFLLSSSLTIR